MQGEIQENMPENNSASEWDGHQGEEIVCDTVTRPTPHGQQGESVGGSKWGKYVEVKEEDSAQNSNVKDDHEHMGTFTTDRTEFVAVCKGNSRARRERQVLRNNDMIVSDVKC